MSKYDFTMDIDEGSSTGKLIRKVLPGSVVLEFGCAAGRMTRYMKEILNCKVYIVEIDQEAFDSALEYAADGVCDDIMSFSWLEKYQNIRFDVILFADVLEHLREPGPVLEKAGTLLKEDGQILISIPNITHNDILLKAFNNSFSYTKVGLLDETHVHFWGAKDIQPFLENSGLYLQNLEATYRDTGTTEQYEGILPDTDLFLLNNLSERLCGKVYQFIITAGKQKREEIPQDILSFFRKPYIRSTMYLDKGNGFNQTNTISCDSVLVSSGEYVAQIVLDNCVNLKKIRFDPVEGQSCIIKMVTAYQGKEALPVGFSNYIALKNEVFLTGTDPMLFIDLASEDIPFSLEVHFGLFGKDYFDIFQNEFTSLCAKEQEAQTNLAKMWAEHEAEVSELQSDLAKMMAEHEAEVQGLQSILQDAEQRNAEQEAEKKTVSKKLQDKEKELTACKQKYDILNANYHAYLLLINRKDALLAGNEKQIAEDQKKIEEGRKKADEAQKRIEALNKQVNAEKKRIANLENTIAVYQNRRVVKAADFVWRILRGMKRRFKRLFGIK